jgi:hypothetical protein
MRCTRVQCYPILILANSPVFVGAGKPVLQSDHASDRRLNLWDCFFCVLVLLR